MNRYIKYKQVCKLAILGNDDINNTTSSQYIIYPSKINGITINNAGTNYNDTSTQINIIGGGGNSAVATSATTSGAISAITLNNSGTDYIGPPSVIITSGWWFWLYYCKYTSHCFRWWWKWCNYNSCCCWCNYIFNNF